MLAESSRTATSSQSAVETLHHEVVKAWPVDHWADLTAIIATSGGADSVALLRAASDLRRAGEGRIIVAHYNHRLRGEESDQDEQFVVELCGKLDVPCDIGRAGIVGVSARSGEGLEAAARRERYDFLTETARRRGARFVATAHTADDQVETVLHHILRGTGIAGLAGIRRCRELTGGVSLIRPLLSVHRSMVLAYLRQLAQPHREDSSNASTEYTRNRIRTELLPLLARQYNSRIDKALLRLAELSGHAQQVVEEQVDKLYAAVIESDTGRDVVIRAERLSAVQPYLQCELLAAIWRRKSWPMRDMGSRQWARLASMIDGGADGVAARKADFPGAISAECVQGRLHLRAPRLPVSRFPVVPRLDRENSTDG